MRACCRETVFPPSSSPRSTSGSAAEPSAARRPTSAASLGIGKPAPFEAISSAITRSASAYDFQGEAGCRGFVVVQQLFNHGGVDLTVCARWSPDAHVENERLVGVLGDLRSDTGPDFEHFRQAIGRTAVAIEV